MMATNVFDLMRLAGDAASAVIRVRGWWLIGVDPVGTIDDLTGLEKLADAVRWRALRAHDDPPFTGGAIGYLSDDASPPLLALPERDPRPAITDLPPVRFEVFDTAVCVSPDGRPRVVAVDLDGWSVTDAAARAGCWEAKIAEGATGDGGDLPDRSTRAPVRAQASLDRDAHTNAVRAALTSIGRGDMYQVNLTMQLAVDWPHGGRTLAAHLWAASPDAAHAAWIRTPDAEIVSVSPETFLRTDGDDVVSRPIKGTRPRSADAAEDARQAEDLTGSEKDSAEHVMIVDLVRNDLGRVCRTGTVRVPDLAALEALPTVWHLTSTVRGVLRQDTGLADLLAAMFPPGSVTGAPKRSAWARIRTLEPVRRGVYCGAVGIVTGGLVDLSVAIRTAVVTADSASYGAGGGIVADSDPTAEHAEALDKAAAFLTATQALPPD